MPECVRCGSYTTIGHPHYCETEPRELPYTTDPGYPEPERIGPPHDHPQRRELTTWRRGREVTTGVYAPCDPPVYYKRVGSRLIGHEYRAWWRGWCIRVYPQMDTVLGGHQRVRWYADCDGRQRVHARWSAEAAQEAACGWVDSELFID